MAAPSRRQPLRRPQWQRFNRNYAEGTLITPEYSAAALLARLAGDDTGAIWDVSTAPAGA